MFGLENSNVSVSLVSHGHGDMVWRLVAQLVDCLEISQVIVTLNIPESSPSHLPGKVVLVRNEKPLGFGANHNAAFNLVTGSYYCVINPDIELTYNPFSQLVQVLRDPNVGLVAPVVINASGIREDSMRRFITPSGMLKRVLGTDSGVYPENHGASSFYPDWVAGMFMLFRSEIYAQVGGFDECYFMYCEDADICTRLWKVGCKVVGCLSASVTHNAQRASRRSFKHLSWHLRSMARYFWRHSLSLPAKGQI